MGRRDPSHTPATRPVPCRDHKGDVALTLGVATPPVMAA